MKDSMRAADPAGDAVSRPFRIRLPGFVGEREVGLGDVVSRVGYALGVAPCGGCRQRRERLNRIVFTR
jgi:hypothetical protein